MRKKFNPRLIIRRIHLFSGLFLLPWVFLYGITAFLFNHPDVFSGYQSIDLPFPEAFMPWVDPESAADDIVAQLNRQYGGPELVRAGKARFSAPLFGRLQGETSGRVTIDFEDLSAKLAVKPGAAESPPGPFDGPVPLNRYPLKKEAAQEVLKDLIQKNGTVADRLQVRRVPQIQFQFRQDNLLWIASYDIASQRLEAKRDQDRHGPKWRSFLLRLHLSHGYRGEVAHRIWAVIVDVMALAMLTWALSGFYMWFQMKKLRQAGWWAVALSLCTALTLGFAMFWMMVS